MKSSKSPKNKALPTAKKAERTGSFLMPKSSEAGRYTAVSRKVSRRAFCKEHVNQQTQTKNILWRINIMAFFQSAVGVLQTLVVALGAGLGIWGAINLMEGYGNDNPGAKSQGMKQLMAGGGVALIGITLVPLLSGLF